MESNYIGSVTDTAGQRPPDVVGKKNENKGKGHGNGVKTGTVMFFSW